MSRLNKNGFPSIKIRIDYGYPLSSTRVLAGPPSQYWNETEIPSHPFSFLLSLGETKGTCKCTPILRLHYLPYLPIGCGVLCQHDFRHELWQATAANLVKMSNLPGPSPWFFCSKKPQIRRRKGGTQQKINTKICKHTKCGGNLEGTQLRKFKNKKKHVEIPMEISEDSCAPLFVLQESEFCHATLRGALRNHRMAIRTVFRIFLKKLGVETNVSNVQNPYDIPLYSLFNRDPYNGKLLLGGSSQDL